jgi:PHD/YefM family antitoxin component YafN of YafNO toxin-antitoxin module
MPQKKLSPQYVLDKEGKKAFVVLPVEEYESLLEDLQDLATIADRRDEPKLSLEEFERELKNDGLKEGLEGRLM